MTTWTRVALGALAVAGLSVLGLSVRYFLYAYRECHPSRSPVTAEERERARRTLPGLEEVEFRGDGGIVLRGWFTPPRDGIVVVLVHGLHGNRASLLPEAEVFARHGIGSLSFDARAHGESGGDTATWGYLESRDVRDAVTFVLSKPGVTHVALLGFSVGASAVARAARDDPRVGAIILYATWPSLREENAYKTSKHGSFGQWPALLGYVWSGVDVGAIRPIDDVGTYAPRPLLMVEGLADEDTPKEVMERVFAAASEPKEIYRVPGAGHGACLSVAPAEYERRVVPFLLGAFGAR